METGVIGSKIAGTTARTFGIAEKTYAIGARMFAIGGKTDETRSTMADRAIESRTFGIGAKTGETVGKMFATAAKIGGRIAGTGDASSPGAWRVPTGAWRVPRCRDGRSLNT